jgi:hypothetical protein
MVEGGGHFIGNAGLVRWRFLWSGDILSELSQSGCYYGMNSRANINFYATDSLEFATSIVNGGGQVNITAIKPAT